MIAPTVFELGITDIDLRNTLLLKTQIIIL